MRAPAKTIYAINEFREASAWSGFGWLDDPIGISFLMWFINLLTFSHARAHYSSGWGIYFWPNVGFAGEKRGPRGSYKFGICVHLNGEKRPRYVLPILMAFTSILANIHPGPGITQNAISAFCGHRAVGNFVERKIISLMDINDPLPLLTVCLSFTSAFVCGGRMPGGGTKNETNVPTKKKTIILSLINSVQLFAKMVGMRWL